jgi:predicted dehydrogenase
MKQINWGIIGCGNVTEVKSGPAFNLIQGSKLVAVMRRNAALAEDYATRHDVPKWYDQAESLIQDPEVNAIYIATPPAFHEAYAVQALLAGKPVYIEKPMSTDADSCQRILDVSQQMGVPVFVAYYRRMLPYFKKIVELVTSGAIGEVRLVQTCLWWPPYPEEVGADSQPKWRVFPEISGGGHFHDLASHQFDFLEYLLGPIKNAKGTSENQAGYYPADDITTAQFEFESGVMGVGSWCFTVPDFCKKDETLLIGSKGSIQFSFFDPVPICIQTREGTDEIDLPYGGNVQFQLIKSVVEHLQSGLSCPSTGITGARANLIMDWITQKSS